MFLSRENFDTELIKKQLTIKDKETSITPVLNEDTVQVIDNSSVLASRFKNDYVGTEHLLFSILTSKKSSLQKLLKEVHIQKNELQKELRLV